MYMDFSLVEDNYIFPHFIRPIQKTEKKNNIFIKRTPSCSQKFIFNGKIFLFKWIRQNVQTNTHLEPECKKEKETISI